MYVHSLCFVLLQFLTDVLDSLFSIFMENSESDTYDSAVFSALVCRLQTTCTQCLSLKIECVNLFVMLSNTVYELTRMVRHCYVLVLLLSNVR